MQIPSKLVSGVQSNLEPLAFSGQTSKKTAASDDLSAILAGKIRQPKSLDELAEAYAGAKPFPHVVMEDMFSPRLLDALIAEMNEMTGDKWLTVDQDTRERTLRMRSAAHMGPAGEELLGIVHSAAFLYFLSAISGIPQLLPDPYLKGGGYASMRRGDYFNVHSDRNVAYESGLTRRLAMIIFLNKSWSAEFAGQLELWSPDATRCEASFDPLFNKTVLFEVAYPNYHGVPTPLACPPDRMRRSFITYYHTAATSESTAAKPHTTIFAPRLHGSNRVTLRSIARDVTPPILTRLIRRLTTS